MPDVGTYGKVNCRAIETLGSGGSAYPCAVLATRMFGDCELSSRGTSGIPEPHLLGESLDIALVGSERLIGTSTSPSSPGWCVLEARFFGGLKGLLLDKQSLPLIATPSSAPLQHDSPKR